MREPQASESLPERNGARRSPVGRALRRVGRVVRVLAFVIVVPLLLGFAALLLAPVRQALLDFGLQRAHRSLPGELHIGRATWTRLSRFDLADLRWTASGDTLLVLDKGRVDIDLAGLVRRDLHLRVLDLQGLQLDLPRLRAAFPPPDTLAPKPPAGKRRFPRPGAVRGVPSVAVDSLRLASTRLQLAPTRRLVDTVILGRAEFRHDHDPGAAIDRLTLRDPGYGVSFDDIALTIDLGAGAQVAARGGGRLGADWPFTLSGATDAAGNYRLALQRNGMPPVPIGEGLAVTGRLHRDGARVQDLSLVAELHTPGTRALARFPGLGSLARWPDLEGLVAGVAGDLHLAPAFAGDLRLDVRRNSWIESGHVVLGFAPGRVEADSLSLSFLDLELAGHWRSTERLRDGRIRADITGTRWLAPFVSPQQLPDSVVAALDASLEQRSGQARVLAAVRGGMRYRGLSLHDLVLETAGAPAADAPLRFELTATSFGLRLSTGGEVRRGDRVQLWLPALTAQEALARPGEAMNLRAPAILRDLPPLGRNPAGFGNGPDLEYDPRTAMLFVHHLEVNGDFGDLAAQGRLDAQHGGTLEVHATWPQAPAALVRRVAPERRDALVAGWQGGSYQLDVNADLEHTSAGFGARTSGTLRLPGPAALAAFLPASAQVEGLGPLEGEFRFAFQPGSNRAGSWEAALSLERTRWLEHGLVRLHSVAGSIVADSVDIAVPGVQIAGATHAVQDSLAGRARLRFQNSPFVRRFVPTLADSAQLSLAVDATLGGTLRDPAADATLSGSAVLPSLQAQSVQGTAHYRSYTVSDLTLQAVGGVRLGGLRLDSLLVAYADGTTAPPAGDTSPLPGRFWVKGKGQDLAYAHAFRLRRDPTWGIDTDSLRVTLSDRDLRTTAPFAVRRLDSGPLAIHDLAMKGSLGKLEADGLLGAGQATMRLEAALELPTPPVWIAIPPGLWPKTLDVHLGSAAGVQDSVRLRVRATGLAIGPQNDVTAALAVRELGPNTRCTLSLQGGRDSLLAATADLTGGLPFLGGTLRGDAPLRVDLALSRFPLPQAFGNPLQAPGYLDRSGQERAPRLTARLAVGNTARQPVMRFAGQVTFQDWSDLRDDQLRIEARYETGPGGIATLRPQAPHADSSRAPLVVQVTGTKGPQTLLTGTLQAPLRISLAPVQFGMAPDEPLDLALDAPNFDLAEGLPFLPGFDALSGHARIRAHAAGPARNPTLEGRVEVPEMEFRQATGTRLAAAGEMTLSGTLQHPQVNGNIDCQHGVIVLPEEEKVLYPTSGSALLWEGRSLVSVGPHQGMVEQTPSGRRQLVPSAQIDTVTTRPESAVPGAGQGPRAGTGPVAPSAAASDSLAALASPEPGNPLLKRVVLDVHLVVPGAVWVRGRGLDIEFAGDAQLLQKDGHPTLLGTLDVQQGSMDYFGRKLQVQEGKITFYGGAQINPSLDVMLVKQTGSVTINLHLTGTTENPHIELTSDPELAEADMLSYILFDKPVEHTNAAQSARIEQSALASAQGYLAGRLTGKLSRSLGIDVLNFQAGSEQDSTAASLTVGQYITPKVLLRYAQDLDQGRGFEVIVDYWIVRGLKLQTRMRPYEQSGLELNWNRDW